MTTPHKATPEQWDRMEAWRGNGDTFADCTLELRDRIAALEQRPIAGSVELAADHFRDAQKMVATDDALQRRYAQAVTDAIQRGATNDELSVAGRRTIYDLGRQHATCPHIVTSDEGTSYCRLAEQAVNSSAGLTGSPAPAGGLVMAVHNAIATAMGHGPTEARAAILAVAAWLGSQIQALSYEPNPEQEGAGLVAARWLREEVQRHD